MMNDVPHQLGKVPFFIDFLNMYFVRGSVYIACYSEQKCLLFSHTQ